MELVSESEKAAVRDEAAKRDGRRMLEYLAASQPSWLPYPVCDLHTDGVPMMQAKAEDVGDSFQGCMSRMTPAAKGKVRASIRHAVRAFLAAVAGLDGSARALLIVRSYRVTARVMTDLKVAVRHCLAASDPSYQDPEISPSHHVLGGKVASHFVYAQVLAHLGAKSRLATSNLMCVIGFSALWAFSEHAGLTMPFSGDAFASAVNSREAMKLVKSPPGMWDGAKLRHTTEEYVRGDLASILSSQDVKRDLTAYREALDSTRDPPKTAGAPSSQKQE